MLLRSELRTADTFPQELSDDGCRLELRFGTGRKSSQKIWYWLCRAGVTELEIWQSSNTWWVSPYKIFSEVAERRLEAELKSFSKLSCNSPHLKGFRKQSAKDKNCQGQGSENKRHEPKIREGRSNWQRRSIITCLFSTQNPLQLEAWTSGSDLLQDTRTRQRL